jgi:two-component system, OmpR family, response regulator
VKWIHIIEGNQNLSSLLAWHLNQAGYQVRQSPNLEHAYRMYDRLLPTLVTIDSDLPDGEGIEFCQWLQKRGNPLTLMISARVREIDVVDALRAGVDDYLKKPFGLPEFLARVEALLRRSRSSEPDAQSRSTMAMELVYEDIKIDLIRRRVYLNDRDIDLTPQEFSLLCVLVQAKGEPVHRQELLHRVWDSSVDNPRTIDTHILALRKKIDRPDLIVTVRKVGYRIN